MGEATNQLTNQVTNHEINKYVLSARTWLPLGFKDWHRHTWISSGDICTFQHVITTISSIFATSEEGGFLLQVKPPLFFITSLAVKVLRQEFASLSGISDLCLFTDSFFAYHLVHVSVLFKRKERKDCLWAPSSFRPHDSLLLWQIFAASILWPTQFSPQALASIPHPVPARYRIWTCQGHRSSCEYNSPFFFSSFFNFLHSCVRLHLLFKILPFPNFYNTVFLSLWSFFVPLSFKTHFFIFLPRLKCSSRLNAYNNTLFLLVRGWVGLKLGCTLEFPEMLKKKNKTAGAHRRFFRAGKLFCYDTTMEVPVIIHLSVPQSLPPQGWT